MISVLTLTYQRHQFLEEAMYSFLHQSYDGEREMVIINDSPTVEYRIDIPNIKVINLNKRFSSVGKKLEFGFTQCSGEYIYRLDDDDLLAPWALELQNEYKVMTDKVVTGGRKTKSKRRLKRRLKKSKRIIKLIKINK